MSQIDNEIKSLETQLEALKQLKEQGVTDAAAALKAEVTKIEEHLENAKRLAKQFRLDFSFMVDGYKDVCYDADQQGFYSSDEYGWSSSSIGC